MRWLPFTCWLALFVWSTQANSKVDELIKLRSASKDGIIQMGSTEFESYAAPAKKSYSLIVFCNAAHMKDTGNLKLPELRKNFQLMAMHAKNAATQAALAVEANKVFFVELEFQESRELFHRLGVQLLPWVMHMGPDTKMKSNRMWSVAEKDRMHAEDYQQYPWTAADFASFVYSHANVNLGDVHEPKLTNNVFFLTFLALMLIPLATVGWKVYNSKWIGHPIIWTLCVLSIFWFATSGGMFNIIRGVPLMAPGPNGRVQWYTQRQGQMGMEGFVIGGMYLMFATACSTLIHLPKYLGGTFWCRPACYINLVVAAFMFFKILDFYTWKTGYPLKVYIGQSLLS